MTTPVIMDIAAAAVLLVFVVLGAREGLFRSLAGLVIIVMALVGAAMISATFATPMAKLVTPLVAERITQRVDEAITAHSPSPDTPGEVDELLDILGLDQDVRESIGRRAEERVRTTGAGVVSAVVESLARSIIYGILYIVSFLALLLVLHVLARAMDLVTKLPGIHSLNAMGGGALGLVKGALVLFLAIWVLRRLGVSFETEAVAQTRILQLFASHTPLSMLSLFQ